jgi:multicomponent Na+:H+ antiporter subunit E
MKENYQEEKPKLSRYYRSKATLIILQFVALFIFWLILSGTFHLEYIIIGLVCSALVTWFTHDFLLHRSRKAKEFELSALKILASGVRAIIYAFWLLWAIIKANIDVALLILNPKMPIDPVFLQFKTEYKWNLTKVTLANSITLTPGTITVDLAENRYLIHAITPSSASDLETANMQNRVGRIFEEKAEKAPVIHWAHSIEELEK